jgi:transcriptional regulator with XRE-family HTH domain
MSAVASISDRVGDLGGYLREQREHARLSVRQLASLAGVSNPYLSQVERGLRKPSAEVLQQIARGLRISAEALYVRAGILDDEGRPDVEAAIHADPDLNERQRRVLLDIYASFRAENRRTTDEPPAAAPVRRRVAASTTRATARVRARSVPEAQPEPAAEVISAPAPEQPEPEQPAPEQPAPEQQAPERPAAEPGLEPAAGRTTTRRATTRATRRATTRSTKAARTAAAAREQAPSTDEDGDMQPDGRS